MGKGEVDPATEIYEVAQQDMKAELEKMNQELAAAKEESFALGILKKIQYDNAHNEFLEYAVLHNIKQAKSYKKGGMTWKQFCDALGKSVRRVDEILSDIRPLTEKFSADFADLSGIKFSKIRYLGRSISADSAEITEKGIQVDDDIIPLTPEHKDDIEAYIDSLKKAESETRQEKEEQVKAKDRVIKALHTTIKDNENELKRYTRDVKPGEISEVEKDQLKGIRDLKGQFEVFLKGMGVDVNMFLYNASEKVKAEYSSLIVYAMKGCESIRDTAHEDFGISIFPQGMADLEAAEWMQDESGADE